MGDSELDCEGDGLRGTVAHAENAESSYGLDEVAPEVYKD
jgi:hypothetical protein